MKDPWSIAVIGLWSLASACTARESGSVSRRGRAPACTSSWRVARSHLRHSFQRSWLLCPNQHSQYRSFAPCIAWPLLLAPASCVNWMTLCGRARACCSGQYQDQSQSATGRYVRFQAQQMERHSIPYYEVPHRSLTSMLLWRELSAFLKLRRRLVEFQLAMSHQHGYQPTLTFVE